MWRPSIPAASSAIQDDLPSLLSWTINVGVLSLSMSSTDASDSLYALKLGTGPTGAITAWLIDAGPVFANKNPDGWTSTTTTPEPSTLVAMLAHA